MAMTLEDLLAEGIEEYIVEENENLAALQAMDRKQIYEEYETTEWTATLPATYVRVNHIETGVKANSIKANLNATEIQKIKDKVGKANGIATLDSNGKVPASQLNQPDWKQTDISKSDYIKNKPSIPKEYVLPEATTSILGGVKPDGTTLETNEGVIKVRAGVFATLGTDGKIQNSQLPDCNEQGIPTNEKGAVNGVATLDSSGKLPVSQLTENVRQILLGTSTPSSLQEGCIYIVYTEG